MQVEGVNAGTYSQSWVRNVAGAGGATIFLGKSRSGSVGGVTIVNNNDQLGGIYWCGADGVDLNTAGASIEAYVDGTPGANDLPSRLVFSTTSDSASSPTERMRIDSVVACWWGRLVRVAISTTAQYLHYSSKKGRLRRVIQQAALCHLLMEKETLIVAYSYLPNIVRLPLVGRQLLLMEMVWVN